MSDRVQGEGVTILVDPPEGWKFGFPKAWDGPGDPLDLPQSELIEWLLKNGYPRSLVDQYAPKLRVRLIIESRIDKSELSE